MAFGRTKVWLFIAIWRTGLCLWDALTWEPSVALFYFFFFLNINWGFIQSGMANSKFSGIWRSLGITCVCPKGCIIPRPPGSEDEVREWSTEQFAQEEGRVGENVQTKTAPNSRILPQGLMSPSDWVCRCSQARAAVLSLLCQLPHECSVQSYCWINCICVR